MTQTATVLQAMDKLSKRFPRGLICCQIAAIVPFTSEHVERIVVRLVSNGKVKKIAHKEDINIRGNECNRYMLVAPDEEQITQTTLFK